MATSEPVCAEESDIGRTPNIARHPRDLKDEGSCRSKPSNTNTCDAHVVEKIVYVVIQFRVNARSDRWHTWVISPSVFVIRALIRI